MSTQQELDRIILEELKDYLGLVQDMIEMRVCNVKRLERELGKKSYLRRISTGDYNVLDRYVRSLSETVFHESKGTLDGLYSLTRELIEKQQQKLNVVVDVPQPTTTKQDLDEFNRFSKIFVQLTEQHLDELSINYNNPQELLKILNNKDYYSFNNFIVVRQIIERLMNFKADKNELKRIAEFYKAATRLKQTFEQCINQKRYDETRVKNELRILKGLAQLE